MQKANFPAISTLRPVWLVILAGEIIVGMAMGLRQVMGLYLKPMTSDLGIGREPFSDAMAIANLVWGLGAIFAGAIADKYVAGRVIIAGALATSVGLLLMLAAATPSALYLSGLLLGIGISGTGITALVGAAGRAVAPEQRMATIATLEWRAVSAVLSFFPTHIC